MARWIDPKRRYALYARAATVCGEKIPCGWCNEPTAGYLGTRSITLDHYIPRAVSIRAGGKADNRGSNLFVACEFCNSARGDTAAEAFGATSHRVRRGWRERIDAQLSAPISADNWETGVAWAAKYAPKGE